MGDRKLDGVSISEFVQLLNNQLKESRDEIQRLTQVSIYKIVP